MSSRSLQHVCHSLRQRPDQRLQRTTPNAPALNRSVRPTYNLSNPLENIRPTTNAKYVMKRGKLYDAMSLDEVRPKAVPLGPYYWENDDVLKSNTKATDVFEKPRKP